MRSTTPPGQMLLIGSKSAHRGAGFPLFFANVYRLRLTRPDSANSSALPKKTRKRTRHRRNDEGVEGKQTEASSHNSGSPHSLNPFNSFFFYTLIIILVKSKVHHKQLTVTPSFINNPSLILFFFNQPQRTFDFH